MGNLLKKSDKMGWWKGADVAVGKETVHVDTLYDRLDKMCRVPERPTSAPMRTQISGIYKIEGVGDVVAGRVEQGVVKPCEEAVFLPTHISSNPYTGKAFTVEMGQYSKGLDKNNRKDEDGILSSSMTDSPRFGQFCIQGKRSRVATWDKIDCTSHPEG